MRYYHGEFDPERLPFRSREEALQHWLAQRIPTQPDVESAREGQHGAMSEEQIPRRKRKQTAELVAEAGKPTLKGSWSLSKPVWIAVSPDPLQIPWSTGTSW